MNGQEREFQAMVVEGEEIFRQQLLEWVRELGWKGVEFSDGMEALNYLGASQVYWRDEGWPDVVIADVDMPEYSGLDLLMAMRASRERVPVILVLSCEDRDVEREAKQLGAEGILCRPFEKATFQHRIIDCANRRVVKQTPIGSY